MIASNKMVVITVNESEYDIIKEFLNIICKELDAYIVFRDFEHIVDDKGKRIKCECWIN